MTYKVTALINSTAHSNVEIRLLEQDKNPIVLAFYTAAEAESLGGTDVLIDAFALAVQIQKGECSLANAKPMEQYAYKIVADKLGVLETNGQLAATYA